MTVVASATLVACSGPPHGADAATTPARGLEAPASDVPWNELGPGWMLATWSPDPLTTLPLTLYLLDPAGGRYPVTTLPAQFNGLPIDPGQTPTLVDWSGDGRHALFEDIGFSTETITDVDLTSGATQTFTVAGARIAAPKHGTYSQPTGRSILLSTKGHGRDGPATLERVDPRGFAQFTFPTDLGAVGIFTGGHLSTPDGTQLVLGGDTGLAVVDNDAADGRQLPIPGPLTHCSPARWWTATVVLALCGDSSHSTGVQCGSSSQSPGSQLWRVPLNGDAPTALTALNSGRRDSGFGEDLSDTDAWQLLSGTFLHSNGECGATFVSRLTPDGHTTAVVIPGVPRGARIAGVTANLLVFQDNSLLTYDPADGTSTVLLGPTVNGGGVIDAIPYPSPTALWRNTP